MSHKKRKVSQKPHPIDQEHSLKSAKHESILTNNILVENHSTKPSRHINPHAAFGARTTLSKGRGK